MHRHTRTLARTIFVLFCALALASGCGGCDPEDPTANNETPNADNAGLDGGANDASGGDAANSGTTDAATNGGGADLREQQQQDAASPFEVNDAGMVDCGGVACACDDGMDNDGDGLIDGLDPECTGPYDDDEGTFATGIPGDNQDPKWQDCFFDGNSGAGDDKCKYHTDCLTGDLPPDDPDCQISQQCFDFCRPLTPNGCDCFGCCQVFDEDGTEYNVVIGGECSTDALGTDACVECQRTDTCVNDCGRCELCLGKTIDDLPADCFDDPNDPDMGTTGDGGSSGGPTCDDGEPVCSSSLDCPDNGYCQLGCCIDVVL